MPAPRLRVLGTQSPPKLSFATVPIADDDPDPPITTYVKDPDALEHVLEAVVPRLDAEQPTAIRFARPELLGSDQIERIASHQHSDHLILELE
jgi:hypothetical protein